MIGLLLLDRFYPAIDHADRAGKRKKAANYCTRFGHSLRSAQRIEENFSFNIILNLASNFSPELVAKRSKRSEKKRAKQIWLDNSSGKCVVHGNRWRQQPGFRRHSFSVISPERVKFSTIVVAEYASYLPYPIGIVARERIFSLVSHWHLPIASSFVPSAFVPMSASSLRLRVYLRRPVSSLLAVLPFPFPSSWHNLAVPAIIVTYQPRSLSSLFPRLRPLPHDFFALPPDKVKRTLSRTYSSPFLRRGRGIFVSLFMGVRHGEGRMDFFRRARPPFAAYLRTRCFLPGVIYFAEPEVWLLIARCTN